MGDSLSPLSQPGLCASAPRLPSVARQVLLSGPTEGAEFAIESLRTARMEGAVEASWAREPLAITETRRLGPDAWLRVNPLTSVSAPDAPIWNALFSRLPADTIPLKEIGEQAANCFATSPALAEILRKRSHNRLSAEVIEPLLPARVWKHFKGGDTVGRHLPRILWVDEGNPPDWIVELLRIRHIEWFVVEGGSRSYDGPIVTYSVPSDENGWFELFRAVSPHAVIRPAADAVWMDCQPLLRGAAAGATLLADPRLHLTEGLPVTPVQSRFDDWRKTIERLSIHVEERDEGGRQARQALEAIGWIEDSGSLELLLEGPNRSVVEKIM